MTSEDTKKTLPAIGTWYVHHDTVSQIYHIGSVNVFLEVAAKVAWADLQL